jgi:hypothetical protein
MMSALSRAKVAISSLEMRLIPVPGFHIHGEHHEGDVLGPVVGDGFRDGRTLAVGLEIDRGRVEELAHDRVFVIVAADFGVGVDIDGQDLGDIHGQWACRRRL